MGSPGSSQSLYDILIEQLRSEGFVCSLPSRAILFMEGETARGIHIISKGHVKLSISSCEGRVLILGHPARGDFRPLHIRNCGSSYDMAAHPLPKRRKIFETRGYHVRLVR